MKVLSKLIGIAALAATIAAPLLYVAGKLPQAASNIVLLGATVVWFSSAAVAKIAGRPPSASQASSET